MAGLRWPGGRCSKPFCQLHIDEPGRNCYNSLWRVLQAYHNLLEPTGLSPHRILFLRDRVSRTLPWMNHGEVARDASAMMTEADDTAAEVCKALQDEHENRAKYFKQGTPSEIPYGWSGTTRMSCPGISRRLGMCRG